MVESLQDETKHRATRNRGHTGDRRLAGLITRNRSLIRHHCPQSDIGQRRQAVSSHFMPRRDQASAAGPTFKATESPNATIVPSYRSRAPRARASYHQRGPASTTTQSRRWSPGPRQAGIRVRGHRRQTEARQPQRPACLDYSQPHAAQPDIGRDQGRRPKRQEPIPLDLSV